MARRSARSRRAVRVKGHSRGHRGKKPGKRQSVRGYTRGRPDPSSYPR